MKILYSELCEKEVINCGNGKSLGFVSDIAISCDDGCIVNLLVQPDGKAFSFKREESICVPWDKIDKIGSDFIIVNGIYPFSDEKSAQKKDGFKLFFSK